MNSRTALGSCHILYSVKAEVCEVGNFTAHFTVPLRTECVSAPTAAAWIQSGAPIDAASACAHGLATHRIEAQVREECARINDEKSRRLAQEAEAAIEQGDSDTCTSNRAAAHLLSVCAARIRAPQLEGEG